jgi:hypothetical protein
MHAFVKPRSTPTEMGKVSREDYINFQLKVFEMMDTNKKQELGVADFIGKTH